MSAVLAYAPENQWPIVDSSYEFLWSLNQKTWLRATKASGEVVEGYFVGMNRSNGAIAVCAQAHPDSVVSGLGVKTLASLQKYSVDRLGRINQVPRELRTWRGKVCM
jgi:CRISPR-associated endonuclease Csn1